MVERSELQKMARTIDAHRQQLDTLHARIEQVSTILEEHDITSSILDQLLKSISTGRAAARLSIGSGVTLNYVHEGDTEGTAMVDIGSGVFGEKPWTEAHSLTAERKQGILLLHQDLTQQSQQLEEKITQLAQEFNAAAEQLQPTQPAEVAEKAPSQAKTESPSEEKSSRRPQRRSGRFGNELTLDD
tara:strand:- start:2233 stop:2793 length:561 start_codon:yes stop_codon:yes gene_type:complete